MLEVRVHPEADDELAASAHYYDECQTGLGLAFLDDFDATVLRIQQAPERWRKIRGDTRKLNFRRFPHAVVYEVIDEQLYIKAVMHLHRRPFYWRHRS